MLRECVLCGRQGVRDFEPAGGMSWRCANRDTCQRRQDTTSPPLPGLTDPAAMAEDTAPVTVATLAGLAREVEALRRAVDQATAVAGRVEELAGVVARVVEDTAAQATPEQAGTPSWLDFADDTSEAEALLDGLATWIGLVYLRYPDGAQGLPGCWLWHPDVVEELLWLQQAWLAAYRQSGAAVSAAGDWHDRLRPGVVRRIKATAGACSLENHQPGGQHYVPAPMAPLACAAGPIARWWVVGRQSEPPAPTEEQLAAIAATRRGGRPR